MIFSAFTSHTFISGSSSNQCSAHDVQHAYCVGCRWCCLPVLAPTFCIQVLTFVMCKEERPNAQHILLSIQPRKIDELLVRSNSGRPRVGSGGAGGAGEAAPGRKLRHHGLHLHHALLLRRVARVVCVVTVSSSARLNVQSAVEL